jgi:meso-butanediol dehydrogenase / (S,S)-butanediol dehydrogenase / diacetyl reductase
VALISGTARDQGRAAAVRFAAEGALVVGGDLLHEGAVETQRLVAQQGGTMLAPGPLDVTAEDAVRSGVEDATDSGRWPSVGDGSVNSHLASSSR